MTSGVNQKLTFRLSQMWRSPILVIVTAPLGGIRSRSVCSCSLKCAVRVCIKVPLHGAGVERGRVDDAGLEPDPEGIRMGRASPDPRGDDGVRPARRQEMPCLEKRGTGSPLRGLRLDRRGRLRRLLGDRSQEVVHHLGRTVAQAKPAEDCDGRADADPDAPCNRGDEDVDDRQVDLQSAGAQG